MTHFRDRPPASFLGAMLRDSTHGVVAAGAVRLSSDSGANGVMRGSAMAAARAIRTGRPRVGRRSLDGGGSDDGGGSSSGGGSRSHDAIARAGAARRRPRHKCVHHPALFSAKDTHGFARYFNRPCASAPAACPGRSVRGRTGVKGASGRSHGVALRGRRTLGRALRFLALSPVLARPPASAYRAAVAIRALLLATSGDDAGHVEEPSTDADSSGAGASADMLALPPWQVARSSFLGGLRRLEGASVRALAPLRRAALLRQLRACCPGSVCAAAVDEAHASVAAHPRPGEDVRADAVVVVARVLAWVYGVSSA